MKIYQVGGSVRDELLGLIPKDFDYVVVGATQQDMLSLGFKQVGADFPVFLHPETNEEYALARTEKKSGVGYFGFTCETKNVTLEEDLMRRDITINAIAKDEQGNIIDPYNGQQDLKNKILRHVSDSFIEDPLRVLRVARFKARYGFNITPETKKLMQNIVSNKELEYLSQERILLELQKGLAESNPSLMLEVIYDIGAWQHIFSSIPYSSDILQIVDNSKLNIEQKHGLIMAHINNKDEIIKLSDRLKIDKHTKQLASTFILLDEYLNNNHLNNSKNILDLLKLTDAIRQPNRFKEILTMYEVKYNKLLDYNLADIIDVIINTSCAKVTENITDVALIKDNIDTFRMDLIDQHSKKRKINRNNKHG